MGNCCNAFTESLFDGNLVCKARERRFMEVFIRHSRPRRVFMALLLAISSLCCCYALQGHPRQSIWTVLEMTNPAQNTLEDFAQFIIITKSEVLFLSITVTALDAREVRTFLIFYVRNRTCRNIVGCFGSLKEMNENGHLLMNGKLYQLKAIVGCFCGSKQPLGCQHYGNPFQNSTVTTVIYL